MDTVIINLTKQESLNLLTFLSRVTLQGSEALAYIQLEQKIKQAQLTSVQAKKEEV